MFKFERDGSTINLLVDTSIPATDSPVSGNTRLVFTHTRGPDRISAILLLRYLEERLKQQDQERLETTRFLRRQWGVAERSAAALRGQITKLKKQVEKLEGQNK